MQKLEQAAVRFARAFEAKDAARVSDLVREDRPIEALVAETDEPQPKLAEDPQEYRYRQSRLVRGTRPLTRWFAESLFRTESSQVLDCSALDLRCRFAQLHAEHDTTYLLEVVFDSADSPVLRRVVVENDL